MSFEWARDIKVKKKFIRTCQECGHRQEDNEPDKNKPLSFAFENRKCKKCKSEALDWGSFQFLNPVDDRDEDEDE